jgi:predicted transcriptional regulator
MAKRAKLEIMRDILKIIRENNGVIKPTPLLRKAGLSSGRFKEYYKDLLEKKLVSESIDGNLDKKISLTDKGSKFLERYRTIVEFIDEFDL